MTVKTTVTQRKPTIALLLEYQYQSNSTLYIIDFLWKDTKKNLANKQVWRRDNTIIKTLQFIEPLLTLNCFTRYSTWSLIFSFVLALPNFKKNYSNGDEIQGWYTEIILNILVIPCSLISHKQIIIFYKISLVHNLWYGTKILQLTIKVWKEIEMNCVAI